MDGRQTAEGESGLTEGGKRRGSKRQEGRGRRGVRWQWLQVGWTDKLVTMVQGENMYVARFTIAPCRPMCKFEERQGNEDDGQRTAHDRTWHVRESGTSPCSAPVQGAAASHRGVPGME